MEGIVVKRKAIRLFDGLAVPIHAEGGEILHLVECGAVVGALPVDVLDTVQHPPTR